LSGAILQTPSLYLIYSIIRNVSLLSAPSAPRYLQATVIPPTENTRPQVKLIWNVPAFPNGILKAYIVSYSHQEAASVVVKTNLAGGSTAVTLPVLGGVVYWFRVKAVTIKEGNDTLNKEIFIPIYGEQLRFLTLILRLHVTS
jgi:hypothetical protein